MGANPGPDFTLSEGCDAAGALVAPGVSRCAPRRRTTAHPGYRPGRLSTRRRSARRAARRSGLRRAAHSLSTHTQRGADIRGHGRPTLNDWAARAGLRRTPRSRVRPRPAAGWKLSRIATAGGIAGGEDVGRPAGDRRGLPITAMGSFEDSRRVFPSRALAGGNDATGAASTGLVAPAVRLPGGPSRGARAAESDSSRSEDGRRGRRGARVPALSRGRAAGTKDGGARPARTVGSGAGKAVDRYGHYRILYLGGSETVFARRPAESLATLCRAGRRTGVANGVSSRGAWTPRTVRLKRPAPVFTGTLGLVQDIESTRSSATRASLRDVR
jgi:hypothetical protein